MCAARKLPSSSSTGGGGLADADRLGNLVHRQCVVGGEEHQDGLAGLAGKGFEKRLKVGTGYAHIATSTYREMPK
jgi:hypothetical protein